MKRSAAALGSAAFFVAAPGTVGGLVPWFLTRWEFHEPIPGAWPYWVVAMVLGVILIVAGLVPLVAAFVQFAKAGGTPAPAAPPPHLVVDGANRWVRNPMYVGVLAVIVGQSLLFGQASLLIYAAAAWAVTAAFVRWYEEPTLQRLFGEEYTTYRRAVPAWWPRLRPWTPHSA
jgi:protein-S-isoprenylcysteine O-methyltransferase Ste14